MILCKCKELNVKIMIKNKDYIDFMISYRYYRYFIVYKLITFDKSDTINLYKSLEKAIKTGLVF